MFILDDVSQTDAPPSGGGNCKPGTTWSREGPIKGSFS